MINFKRSSGFRTSLPPTPHRAALSALTAACPPYAALGFIARTSDGQLLRLNALAGRTTPITYKRRRTQPA